uniref:Dystrophin n=1 Tax=Parascaris equorum TaxID=6256 RepID=A0A914R6W0_PAREQ
LSEGGKVSELSEEALRAELKEVEGISGGIEEMKNKMAELNVRSNALLDEFRADEGHNLSHSISKMNTLWSKFNDKLLEQWLDRVESSLSSLNGATLNKQTLKDSVKRKEWIDNEKSIRAEMDAHDDVVRSVEQMGVKLVRSVEDLNERERLGDRLNSVSERWRCMSALANNIR